VQIVDASIAGALAPVLAEARFESAVEGQWEIPFTIDVPDLRQHGRDIRIIARVTKLPGEQVSAHDYLTMENIQLVPDARADDWVQVPTGKVKESGE
jgi:hypothetical protein